MPRKGGSSSSSSKADTPGALDKRIGDTLRGTHVLVLKCQEKKGRVERSLGALEAAVERSGKAGKAKLKAAYIAALKDSEAEAEALREALRGVERARELRAERKALAKALLGTKAPPMRRGALMVLLGQAAGTQPLWLGKLGDAVPPLCGATPEPPGHQLRKGDGVAGLVKGQEDEHNWILAEVRGPSGESGTRWELEDVDEEQREKYVLPRRKIIPLPVLRANPSTHPQAIFPVGAVVLALYPQTTCFYKGQVEAAPASLREDYHIAFEDPTYPAGFSPPLPVPQRYVIAYKDIPGARVK